MPSVIELPSDFSSPFVVTNVDRRAHRIGEIDLDVRVALLQRDADPRKVPPVPTEQVKPSTLPSVWSQISGPVVS